MPHGLLASLVFRVLVALIVPVVFGRTQNDLAGAVAVRKRQRLKDHIEPVARLVRECRADRKLKFDCGIMAP